MNRRTMLGMLATTFGFGMQAAHSAERWSAADVERTRQEWKALLPRNADVPLAPQPLDWSREMWKRALTPAQFSVLREEGTEPPFTSPLNKEKRAGVFVCAG